MLSGSNKLSVYTDSIVQATVTSLDYSEFTVGGRVVIHGNGMTQLALLKITLAATRREWTTDGCVWGGAFLSSPGSSLKTTDVEPARINPQ